MAHKMVSYGTHPWHWSASHNVHSDVGPVGGHGFYGFFWSDRVCIGDRLGTRRREALL